MTQAAAPLAARIEFDAPRALSLPPLTGAQVGGAAVMGVIVASLAGAPLFAVALALWMPFLFATSLRTKTLTYFVAMPLVGAIKYNFPAIQAQKIPHLMTIGILAHLIVFVATNRVRFPMRHPLVLLSALYGVAVIVQAFTPLSVAHHVGFSGAALYLEPLLMFIVGLLFWADPGASRRFLRVVVISAFFVGLYTLKQFIFGFSPAELVFKAKQGDAHGVHEFRLFSTLSGPAAFGFVSVVFILFCVAGLATKTTPRRLTIATLLISTLGLAASGTRIAMAGAVIAGAMMLLLLKTTKGQRRLTRQLSAAAVAVVVVLGTIVAATPIQDRHAAQDSGSPIKSTIVKLAMLKAGSSDDDYAGRVARFDKFTEYMRHHPWGAGAGAVRVVRGNPVHQVGFLKIQPDLPPLLRNQPWIFQHDFYYFSLGVELGALPTLLFLMIFIGGVLYAFGARIGETDVRRKMVLSLAGAIIAFALIHNLTNESFRTPQVAAYTWFLLASVVALPIARRREAGPADAAAADDPVPSAA